MRLTVILITRPVHCRSGLSTNCLRIRVTSTPEHSRARTTHALARHRRLSPRRQGVGRLIAWLTLMGTHMHKAHRRRTPVPDKGPGSGPQTSRQLTIRRAASPLTSGDIDSVRAVNAEDHHPRRPAPLLKDSLEQRRELPRIIGGLNSPPIF